MILTIVFALIGLLALSLIVFIHELGHFIAAKKSGILVEEFGIGLPPRVWGKKIGETIYSINALPIGGFVRLHGEILEENAKYPGRAFNQASSIKRIFIALAGVFMNFVLALVCFTIVYSIIGVQTTVETGQVTITDIAPESPAQVSGFLAGDIVLKVNQTPITTSDEFVNIVDQNKGSKIIITILRNSEEKVLTITPRVDPPAGEGAMGVSVVSTAFETYYPPLWQRPIVGLQLGLNQTIEFTKAVLGGFGQITQDVGAGRAPQGVVGITGILALFAFMVREGAVSVINFMGLVSLNLAIFNLIPFPPLDGSRVLFVIVEKLVGRKYLPKIEVYAHSIGMIILIAVMIIVTGREIPKLISAGSLTNFVEGLVK